MKNKVLKYGILIAICFIALILLGVENKVQAATAYNSEISYEEDYKGNVTVMAAGKYIENATIPSKINGKPVTEISNFQDCKYLKTVTIPSSVTEIDWNCFSGCEALQRITIPSSVKIINPYAFQDCKSLTTVTLPKTISEMGRATFFGCTSLKTVTIENGITIIPRETFEGCKNLTTINIPNTVTEIGYGAFKNCTSLTTMTIPATVKTVGDNYYEDGIFSGCTSLKSVTINAQIERIPDGMFYHCSALTTVNLPTTIKTMGRRAFEGCTALRTITLPEGLTNIGYSALRDCKNLSTIKLSDTIENIEDYAFSGCTSLTSIKMGTAVKSIGYECFENCSNLKNLYFTKSIQQINSKAFEGIPTSQITFYGYSGTAAKAYATEKGFKYVECTPVSSIKISGPTTVLKKSSISLKAIVSPTSAYHKEVKWTSSNTNIATVTQSGVVTGKSAGTATITATAKDGTAVKGIYNVKVVLTKLPFNDVTVDDWYYDVVDYTYTNGIIKGYNKTQFAPNKNLTRGQLATMLWRMEGSPKATSGKNFSDVKTTHEFYTPIKWASSKGIVSGYKNGKFGVNDNITREDLAVMLNNYAKYKGKKVTSTMSISKYKDNKKVSSYAKPSVQWAIEKGIISGKESGTKIDPQGKATRAEVAAMIYSYKTRIK